MREFDLIPVFKATRIANRTIHNKIIASYRNKEFFDGLRQNGYGGMKHDGRWKPIAERICKEYQLNGLSWFLQIQCEKGYLLDEMLKLHPDMRVRGTETSLYARQYMPHEVRKCIVPFDFPARQFHFVLALGIYVLNLPDLIKRLKEIQRIGIGRSYITLASYETHEDLELFKRWSLLSSTILKKHEWLEVLEHCHYSGDYSFVNSKTLNLCSP